MRGFRFLSVVSVLTMVLMNGCAPNKEKESSLNDEQVVASFDEVLSRTDLSNYTADVASVPWGASYFLKAFAYMYQATNDVKYLKMLGSMSLDVLNLRADKSVKEVPEGSLNTDGSVKKLWFTNYSGSESGFAVTTGMATYPMAVFVNIVYKTPNLQNITLDSGKTLIAVARELDKAIEESIAAHEVEWDETNGVYKFNDTGASYPGMILPANQYLALARTLLIVGKTKDNASYLNRVHRMAERFKSTLKLDETANAYSWAYWPEWGPRDEDFSHGAIDIDFVSSYMEYGQQTFNQEELGRLANTFSEKIVKGPDTFAESVSGDGVAKTPESASMYMGLSMVDPEVHKIIQGYFQNLIENANPESARANSPLVLIGLASTMKYRP
ncbi:MAG: hypothetical protein AB7T49_05330 [Oligoflexales bacterium]